MESIEIEKIRETAARSFAKLSSPDTTVYAVAHARKENSAEAYDSDDVINRFDAILSPQLEAIDCAVARMKDRIAPKQA